jgi:uncharacterized membrane protein
MSPATVTVWHFESAMGAAACQIRLRDLQRHGRLRVLGSVTVIWVPGSDKPHFGHLLRRSVASVSEAAVLADLVAALRSAPEGTATSDDVEGHAAPLRRAGLEDSLLRQVTDRLVPGTSTLVVLSSGADVDTVEDLVERGVSRGDVALLAAWPSTSRAGVLSARRGTEPARRHAIARSG